MKLSKFLCLKSFITNQYAQNEFFSKRLNYFGVYNHLDMQEGRIIKKAIFYIKST